MKICKRDHRESQGGGGGNSRHSLARATLRRWMRRIVSMWNSYLPSDEGPLANAIEELHEDGFYFRNQKYKDFMNSTPFGNGYESDEDL
jgi:hypothetical protein